MRIRELLARILGREPSFPGEAGDSPHENEPRYVPIEDYALIGDRISAALVSKYGSIDWACFPYMDSESVFARILDADGGGSFCIAPTHRFHSSRAYREDTSILETTFTCGTGTVVVTDFMPARSGELQRLGDGAIIRIVRGVTGRVEMGVNFDPRFDYGREMPTWDIAPGMGARSRAAGQSLTLYSSRVRFEEQESGGVYGTFETRPGDEYRFVLSYRKPAAMMFTRGMRDLAPAALEATERYWREWIARCSYTGPHAGMVRRSAITLRMLDFAPTGAIAAAPTTSLPETRGGIRNWDYRYCWIRDSAFTLYSFFVLGYPEEAEIYLQWLFDVTLGDPARLQVLYGINGEHEATEVELDHMEGYGGARPVRIGNGAKDQLQLDMYGEILDCAYLMHRHGGVVSQELWDWLRQVVDYVCEIWDRPDNGPWEIRSEPRHFVYSKALCWVAVDRGIRMGEQTGLAFDRERWTAVRDAIHAEVMAKGFKESLGAFTAAYDGEDLDAALLALPLRRFIDANDPRMIATVERIQQHLEFGEGPGLIRRVSPHFEDGLHGEEGSFMLCSFWLVDCLAMQGRVDEAEELLASLLERSNDVGLYAEMLDPKTGHHLGNFPQAFTHIALINAATSIEHARQKPATTAS
jgi:GH15 family glucan-1,4-alpha-glucosidase